MNAKDAARTTLTIADFMVESYLSEGAQPFPRPRNELKYGVSITDACIGWDLTERMLRSGAKALAEIGSPEPVAAA